MSDYQFSLMLITTITYCLIGRNTWCPSYAVLIISTLQQCIFFQFLYIRYYVYFSLYIIYNKILHVSLATQYSGSFTSLMHWCFRSDLFTAIITLLMSIKLCLLGEMLISNDDSCFVGGTSHLFISDHKCTKHTPIGSTLCMKIVFCNMYQWVYH